ncbi:MAG TPA: hypothetical protein VLZ06_00950 [Solirubrobacteraceae bacterium]|nr:hypothetical protein [Solirubrobacteraceae bacterium]
MGRRALIVGSRVFGALAVVIGVAMGASPALAGWSAPLAVSRSTTGFLYVAPANDARGDSAVAWASETNAGPVQTRAAVNVALAGAGGRPVERALWRSNDALVGGVAVALDASGELTVAWIEAARGRNGATLSPHTIRAAYRSPSGRWSPAQVVGYSGPFLDAHLELAVAPNREVLLSWVAHTKSAPGVAAAWRKAGHRFGSTSAISRARSAMMIDPTPLFDSGGSAHVYGTVVSCGRVHTCATMVSTAPHSHRFGAPLLIAPAPAEYPVVSFGAPGRALIAWEAGDYQGLEPFGAPPYARVMSGGSLGAPVALQPGSGSIPGPPNAVAANGGGGTVSWSETPPSQKSARTMVAVGDAAGHFPPPSVSPLGLVPALRDGAGDVLLTLGPINPFAPLGGGPTGPAGTPLSPIAMQPAGGGAVQSSPIPLPPTPMMPSLTIAAIATTQPVGAGAAVAWVAGAKLEVSTWRP